MMPIGEFTLNRVLAEATDAGSRVLTVAMIRLADGPDWDDIEPVKVAVMQEIAAITGGFLREQAALGPLTADVMGVAKTIAVRAWEGIVAEWFDVLWDGLWKRLPALARWVPWLKGSVGAFLKARLMAAGPDLLEAAVSGAKAAERILAR